MKILFYPRLALDGIRKNRRLYLPYILTCIGMIMLFYLIHYLAAMETLVLMPGGGTTAQMLGFGVWVVALFAMIFLVYTNSFLMRRRKKEFGLYNILGMNKVNLSLLLLWETLIIFAISVAGGLFCGILFSKLAEIGLTNVLGGQATYKFSISKESVADVFLIFVPIFGVIYLKGLWQVWRMSAIALLKSESAGEKPPRANYLFGIAGLLILAAAYYIAVSIQNPLAAFAWFFVAVLMVIIATYLLFTAGSVTLCRLLQKNKRYYYKKNHFVSVSSMAYRMKRNGASLASICVLSTMVLVMLLGSGSLYLGSEDIMNKLYPFDVNIKLLYANIGNENTDYKAEKVDYALDEVHAWLNERGANIKNEQYYLSIGFTAMVKGDTLMLDYDTVASADMLTLDTVADVYFVPIEDYNRLIDPSATLNDNEALLFCRRIGYAADSISMPNGVSWQIKDRINKIFPYGESSTSMLPYIYIVVNDIDAAADAANEALGEYAEVEPCLRWGFDLELEGAEQIKLYEDLRYVLYDIEASEQGGCIYSFVDSRELRREDTFGMTAGIFFLGVFLSIVFMLATTLMIYYKQITEGYEDENRFAIMRAVGMTKQDIRKNINSQMLTVFFLPLITAALHLSFAFPMVQKLLALFNLQNEALSLIVMAVTVLAFGLVYAFIYKATSNAYYSIVSGKREA